MRRFKKIFFFFLKIENLTKYIKVAWKKATQGINNTNLKCAQISWKFKENFLMKRICRRRKSLSKKNLQVNFIEWTFCFKRQEKSQINRKFTNRKRKSLDLFPYSLALKTLNFELGRSHWNTNYENETFNWLYNGIYTAEIAFPNWNTHLNYTSKHCRICRL